MGSEWLGAICMLGAISLSWSKGENMHKKEFDKLVAEATKEFNEERKERVKDYIKERLREYELAKATVARIEEQFLKLKKSGFKQELLSLGYQKK